MAKKIFTVPSLTFRKKIKAPAKSEIGAGTIYLDRSSNSLLISVDGGNFVPIGTGTINVGTTTVALATNEICTFTSYELAGGGNLPASSYSFNSVGSVNRDGIIQSVQLYNSTTDTVIAIHTHSGVASTSISTDIDLDEQSVVEIRHKLIGTLIDGDFGQLVSAMVSRS